LWYGVESSSPPAVGAAVEAERAEELVWLLEPPSRRGGSGRRRPPAGQRTHTRRNRVEVAKHLNGDATLFGPARPVTFDWFVRRAAQPDTPRSPFAGVGAAVRGT
jgi:hypothetical protein